ncbi:hypothetical protein D910_10770 [Dendroctonus ponderosae]|uniref:Multidrug resistance-associated protein lethal(2)03659 n=1 Tax=Dendroctonus ponderosae TaxID=77166 RepID=U4UTL5_DENPD|nr:hypothetical protein D910_10770 [Dendroctonus ponderosae]
MIGRKRDLDEFDLTEPLEEHKSSILGEKLARNWTKEVQNSAKKTKNPSLTRVIIKTFKWDLIFYGFLLFVMELVSRLPQPIFIGLFIRYFNPKNLKSSEKQFSPTYLLRAVFYFSKNQSRISKEEAFFFATCIMMCSLITVGIFHPYIMAGLHVGMQIRVACCSLVYRKALRIKLTALGGETVGNTVNLMSNDVNRFDQAPLFLHYLWISPLQACLIAFFIYLEMGDSSFYGMSAVAVVAPLQILMCIATAYLRVQAASRTDKRVRHMNEVIQAMQVIKMYAWENAFIDVISRLRKKELKMLVLTSYIRGITMSFLMITARAGIFLTVLSYVWLDNAITAEQVFVIGGYYLIIRISCTVYFPLGLNAIAEAQVSIRRIERFLLTDEAVVGDRSVLNPDYDPNQIVPFKREKGDLNLRASSVFSADFPLRDASSRTTRSPEAPAQVTISRGIAKYGKALCLDNINTQMSSGQLVAIVGVVGSGKTCLLNLILGELKLFSGKLHVSGVVSYASQEPWLFADKYMQVIKVCALKRDFSLLPFGDRTIVGERGTSLSGGQRARINLARAIYKEADIYLLDDPLSAVDIQQHLKDKLVILVTHQLQYLKRADQILILNEGTIEVQGTYEEIKRSGLSFALLLEESTIAASSVQPEQEKEMDKVLKAISLTSTAFNSAIDIEGLKLGPKMTPEMRTSGAVALGNYKSYFKAGGNCWMLILMCGLFLGAQFLGSGGDYFLSQWVNLEELRANYGSAEAAGFWNRFNRQACINIYTGIMIATIVVVIFRSLYFFSICMRASYRLHNRMFESIIKAAMRFFHQNTSGRILNRFSKDLGQVDELLPNAFIDTVQLMLTLVGSICVVCTINTWFLLPVSLMMVLFYFLRKFYLKTSRSVKRLEGIARSPVFAHLNATLQGLQTIRINNAEKNLAEEFDHLQDIHSSAWFMFLYTSRAFSLWLDWITALFIGVVTYTCVISPGSFQGSSVGLIITQAISLTGLIQWGMRQSAELENQMTSVERVLEFTRIEHEPDLDSIGIVGRTGAGKSSLILTLFRLAYFEGEIYIDHLDISVLGLHDLRRKISIIPQEPVVFHGTLRYNLDPFDEHTDQEMLSALVDVEDKDAISKGLGGQNVSVGQRQMICLVRAILKNNKILVMDEATANMDAQTDKLIQKTIRTKFAQCTVLTIAHRLHTVMDSDKILVMDAGEAVEFDHPNILLQNPKGYLSELVRKTGTGTAAFLKKTAKEASGIFYYLRVLIVEAL